MKTLSDVSAADIRHHALMSVALLMCMFALKSDQDLDKVSWVSKDTYNQGRVSKQSVQPHAQF